MFGCACNNRKKSCLNSIKFFRFPRDERLSKIWITLCKRNDNFNVNTARLCSKHFRESDYQRNLKHELLNYKPNNYRKLKFDAVPSLFLPGIKKSPNEASTQERERRIEKRSQKILVDNILNRYVSIFILLLVLILFISASNANGCDGNDNSDGFGGGSNGQCNENGEGLISVVKIPEGNLADRKSFFKLSMEMACA